MDQLFLEYYNDDLNYLRHLASDFADLNTQQAKHLSLKEVPCPDPYVERLLEGVAFLAARTRLKVDAETTRLTRDILEMLYPDLAAPTPALGRAVLEPGDNLVGVFEGYNVTRGTRLVADPQEGLQTRATYTTCQDVMLWPIKVQSVEHMSGRDSLVATGLEPHQLGDAEAALRIEIAPLGTDPLSAYAPKADSAGELGGLDSFDFTFDPAPIAGALFDTVHGLSTGVLVRPKGGDAEPASPPEIIGLSDDESLFPRTRAGFEGYRLLREYFVLPERFHNMRIRGLGSAVKQTTGEGQTMEIFVLLRRPAAEIASVRAANVLLFATPIVNLFERDCSTIEIDKRKNGQVVHADRARPLDYEIYSLVSVKDLDRDDSDERGIANALSIGGVSADGPVYALERRPRRPSSGERSQGKFRSTYDGDDVVISISDRRQREDRRAIKRLDIRATCTNRDLAVIERNPKLTPQTGLPVAKVRLISSIKRPLPALKSGLLKPDKGVASIEDVSWRLVAQFSLGFLSLAEEGQGEMPLRGLLDIYADRGDPALKRHARALVGLQSREVPDRLPLSGPICFGLVTDIACEFDDQVFTGHSKLLLGALLGHLFARYAALNAFIRCTTNLSRSGEHKTWPIMSGARGAI